MIRKLLPKLISVEKAISDEKGSFRLFGIFLREGQPNRAWDLVISADWLDTRTLESERTFIKDIQSRLEREEFLLFALVPLLTPDHPLVEDMNTEFEVEHGDVEFIDYDFNGMVYERGHVITSKRRESQKKEVTSDLHTVETLQSRGIPRSYRCAGWGSDRVKVHKLVEKLGAIEKELASEWGGFTLFALFLREDQAHQTWDLVVSADWLDANRLESERAFIKELQSRLEQKEFRALARILILEPFHPLVKEITSEFDVEHRDIEIDDYDVNGMVFELGHIITGKPVKPNLFRVGI
jgi:hypothetical protein